LKKIAYGRNYRSGSYKEVNAYRPQMPRAYAPRHGIHPAQAYGQPKVIGQEQSYRPKVERLSYSSGKVWTEPTPFRLEKERLVYDPEVKELLKRIEDRLANLEPDAEQILKAIEKHPELYDELSDILMEKMDRDFEKLEAAVKQEADSETQVEDDELEVENKAKSETAELEQTEQEATAEKGLESVVEANGDFETTISLQTDEAAELENSKESEPVEEPVNEEASEEDEFWRDLYLENEADVLREMEAEEMLEQSEGGAEEAIEGIESQDLTELEAELFSDVEENEEAGTEEAE